MLASFEVWIFTSIQNPEAPFSHPESNPITDDCLARDDYSHARFSFRRAASFVLDSLGLEVKVKGLVSSRPQFYDLKRHLYCRMHLMFQTLHISILHLNSTCNLVYSYEMFNQDLYILCLTIEHLQSILLSLAQTVGLLSKWNRC
jgi:hypothetical protein